MWDQRYSEVKMPKKMKGILGPRPRGLKWVSMKEK